MTDLEAVVAGLSGAQKRDLTIHWDEFCDAEPLSHGREFDAFLNDMEAAGFAQLVPVDQDALEDAFAYERGIEAGGMMWELTGKALAVRAALIEKGEG